MKLINGKNKGITLVALVITIIILLILAGISIAQLTGNGLFENAKLAKEKYKNAQEKEDAILKEYADYMKNNGDLPENTQDTEAGTQVQLKDGWSIKAVRNVYTDDGKEEELGEVATVYAVAVGEGETVPVPYGFWYVGGNLNTGVVISDDETDKYDGHTDKVAWEYTTNLKGNQFVWIPCTEDEYQKTLYGMQNSNWETTVEDAEKTQIQKYGGFYVARYEAGLATTILEFEETQTQADSNDIYNKDGVPQSRAGQIPWMFIDWNKSKANADKMYSGNKYVNSGLITGTQWDVMLNTIVNKTDLEESDLKNSSKWGNYCDNQITYTGRKATDIYADSKWTLTPFDNEVTIKGTTTKYGNESGGDLLTTGASETVEKYNIYDVAGNLWEWTEENSTYQTTGQYRVVRGGSYLHDSDTYPACYRYGGRTVNDTWLNIGFRVSLYLK